MTTEEFQHIVSGIPSEAGIYKYFDLQDELIYVGKAKNIRKRVSSYFTRSIANYKTHELVRRISRIEFTILNSEQDAFLLENSLIKKFKPYYNINLKDDKSYPYIIIKNEPFPRVFLTRKRAEDGSEYLGPYTSVKKVKELIEFIRQMIPLRNCTLNLSDRNIAQKKFKVCLEYHLGNCKGPCEGLQTKTDYEEGLRNIRNLLRGNLAPVIRFFKSEMKLLSASMEFEKAEILRKKIEFLENYQARSLVVGIKSGDLDVFSIVKDKETAFVNYLEIRTGSIVQTQTSQFETHLGESDPEILVFAVQYFRIAFHSDCSEIVVPFEMDYPIPGVTITVPQAGDKKKLIELSEKNATFFIEEIKRRSRLHLSSPDKIKATLEELQTRLQLGSLPGHIECFDNSNFQGSFPVSAMVCFRDGVPSKKDYRKFNIKSVDGIDDFASMKEAVYRRYKRVMLEGGEFPQLIIIDGGKGQLSAAVKAMEELDARGKTTTVGLAKNSEELFFPGDKEPVRLSYNSEALRLIRRIRDEVHRFAISFHRNKRSSETFRNKLENLPGFGKSTVELLIRKYKSVKKIRETSKEELEKLVGKTKSNVLMEFFELNN